MSCFGKMKGVLDAHMMPTCSLKAIPAFKLGRITFLTLDNGKRVLTGPIKGAGLIGRTFFLFTEKNIYTYQLNENQ